GSTAPLTASVSSNSRMLSMLSKQKKSKAQGTQDQEGIQTSQDKTERCFQFW
ncbi:12077_t:CDS:1, partial [Ambispora leptoticha]